MAIDPGTPTIQPTKTYPEGKFDIVFSSHVLNVIPEKAIRDEFVQKAWDKVAVGGHLVVAVRDDKSSLRGATKTKTWQGYIDFLGPQKNITNPEVARWKHLKESKGNWRMVYVVKENENQLAPISGEATVWHNGNLIPVDEHGKSIRKDDFNVEEIIENVGRTSRRNQPNAPANALIEIINSRRLQEETFGYFFEVNSLLDTGAGFNASGANAFHKETDIPIIHAQDISAEDVGKQVSTKNYVELSYIGKLGSQAIDAYEKLKEQNPSLAENVKVVDYDTLTGKTHFSTVPTFDKEAFPKIETSITYNPELGTFSERGSGQLLHRVAEMVGEDYDKFDLGKRREEQEDLDIRIEEYNKQNPDNPIRPQQLGGTKSFASIMERLKEVIENISEATGYWEDVPEHEKMIYSPRETEPLINPDLYTPPEPLVHPDLYKPREPLIHPETKNPTGPYINVGSKLKQGIGSWLPFPGQGTVAAAALRANRSNNK
tara:strand:+ start:51 stop:1514 length:1464 start_codon:yes stop_codon:yes gene_type:complete